MELDNLTKSQKETIEVHVKKQQEQEYKLIGHMKRIPGLVLWEFDYNNLKLNQAQIIKQKSVSFITRNKTERDKVLYNPKCYYFQAHCWRTAAKRCNKIIYSSLGFINFFPEKQSMYENNN